MNKEEVNIENETEELEECERCGNYVTELHDELCDCCYDDMYE